MPVPVAMLLVTMIKSLELVFRPGLSVSYKSCLVDFPKQRTKLIATKAIETRQNMLLPNSIMNILWTNVTGAEATDFNGRTILDICATYLDKTSGQDSSSGQNWARIYIPFRTDRSMSGQ